MESQIKTWKLTKIRRERKVYSEKKNLKVKKDIGNVKEKVVEVNQKKLGK